MVSLQHVLMLSEGDWKPITAEEAANIHPGGTVSAHSGLFICDLCGQYVSLIDGQKQIRHFRHTSYEKSKNCPERTFSNSISMSYNSKEHELPIRILGITEGYLRFELGLIRVPETFLSGNLIIEIKSYQSNDRLFAYSKERLNYNSISYVSLGDTPHEKYTLKVSNVSDEIYDYWPKEIKGIDLSGTLFEVTSGRKLPYGSDIEVGREYYFLTKYRLISDFQNNDIDKKEIKIHKSRNFLNTYIYIIKANSMNENAAKFFLKYHYRLTKKPIVIQPIWPPYVEDSYTIKHNQNNFLLHIKGNTNQLKTFPETTVDKLYYNSTSKLYKVNCKERQQLISTGRISALKYTYFWREPITCSNNDIEFSVCDILGKSIKSGEIDYIPKNGILCVKSSYDGELVIKYNENIREKIKINANQYIEVDNIANGNIILLYIGLDCIWKLIVKNKFKKETDINNIILDIVRSKGAVIQAPHSLKNIAFKYKSYPQLYKWILNCIKNDEIYENAFRKLEKLYLNKNK